MNLKHKKKKVLMYHTKEGMVGGPTTYIKNIVTSQLSEQYDFYMYYQNCAPNGFNYKLLKRLIKDFKEINPDIIHVHGLQSEGFYGVIAAKIAGCENIVTTIHGFAFDDLYTSKIKRFLYRFIVEPITIRMSTKVYCVCKYAYMRQIVKRNSKRNNFGYVWNPVPELQIIEEREIVRAKCLFKKNDVVFAISGRIVEDKGFVILEKIVTSINEKGIDNFKLLIIGDGGYRSDFEKKMQKEIEEGQIVITGQTDRVIDYLNASDAFVLPSYHENLPLSLLEAGKMGLPCVVSNVGGIPEIIHNNITGFIVEEFDPEKYVEYIVNIINDSALRKKMSENIRKDIDERFAMKAFCERIDKIYKYETKNTLTKR